MRRALLPLLSIVAACHSSSARPTVDADAEAAERARFAEILRTAIDERPPPRFDREQYALIRDTDAGPGNQLNLENFYHEYRMTKPEGRAAIVARYVAVWKRSSKSEPLGDLASAKSNLMPVIREGVFFETTALDTGMEMLHRPLVEPFHVALVIDLPDSMRYVGKPDLDRWHIDFDRALAIARQNLAARSRAPFETLSPGLLIGPWHDSYDASRILLDDRFRGLAIRGAPVVVMPNRNNILIAGDADGAALQEMVVAAEAGLREPRPMTVIALRLQGKHWTPFLPDKPDELHRRLKRLEVTGLQELYAQQGQSLERSLAKKGEDIFVAHYDAVEKKASGAVTSYSVWSRGVATLLPKSDRICFVDPDLGKTRMMRGCADWATVLRLCGKNLTPLGMSPERYRVGDFPTPLQLGNMHLSMEMFP